MSYLEGKVLGTHDKAHENLTSEEDVDRIIALIQATQKVQNEKLLQLCPEVETKDMAAALNRESWMPYIINPDLEKMVQKGDLEPDFMQKFEQLLQETEAQIAKNPNMIMSEDIFTINLMKIKSGDKELIGSFDWERPFVGNNPAYDYGKFITRYWNQPELQQQIIKKTLEANKHIEGFKQTLAGTLAGIEGRYFLWQFYLRSRSEAELRDMGKTQEEITDLQKQKTHDPDSEKDAPSGFEAMRNMFDEILNKKGIWA